MSSKKRTSDIEAEDRTVRVFFLHRVRDESGAWKAGFEPVEYELPESALEFGQEIAVGPLEARALSAAWIENRLMNPDPEK